MAYSIILLSNLFVGAALSCALFVQSTASPIAGVWFLFFFVACLLNLYRNGHQAPDLLILLFTSALCLQAFLFSPVFGGASILVVLLCIPGWLLCANYKNYNSTGPVVICGIVLAVYAAWIVLQSFLDIPQPFGNRISLPLINPNNTALLMNLGLIGALQWFWPLAPLFGAGLFLTGSKAGILTGVLAVTVLLMRRNFWAGLCCFTGLFFLGCYYFDQIQASVASRIQIWESSIKLLALDPYWGTGLGTFLHYYKFVRTETETLGMFAHNDFLHLAIEAGIPVAMLFMGVIFYGLRKLPLTPRLMLAAITLQSLVEFQFYVPPVAILTGLILAETRSIKWQIK